MASSFKKIGVKLELLTNTDMLLMVEKSIRVGICQAIHRYAKATNKYVKDHDENKELSYLRYSDINNLHGCVMLQKLFWMEIQ